MCEMELCPLWNGDGGFCLGDECDPFLRDEEEDE